MSESDSEAFDESAWRDELTRYRRQKDQFFATERQSPIPEDQRDGFDGLSYFEPDATFRVEATVEPVDGEETITMDTSVDTEVDYRRVARLRFELDEEEYTLVGYQQADGESNSLFVPFRDKTTGQQTYGAGRYMEFEVGDEEGTAGEGDSADLLADVETVTLDFNLAYHPFCAYNDAFACPLPPEENWLDAVVDAGEKLPDA